MLCLKLENELALLKKKTYEGVILAAGLQSLRGEAFKK